MKHKIKFSLLIFQTTFLFNVIAQPPANYYNNAANKNCAALKTALKTILQNSINPKIYSALLSHNATTEIKPRTVGTGSANVIFDIYSTNPNGTDPYQFTPTIDQCGSYNGEGDCYNREHSVPQSWFSNTSGQPAAGPGTDFHHIYPTDGEVNARHSNHAYGEVAVASWTSLTGNKLGTSAIAGIPGTVFEPLDSFKGDLARAFLYFVTMYEDDMSGYNIYTDNSRAFAYNTFPSVKIDYLRMMIRWHKLDPVSSKERNRNNAAYTFQGNRNPFVDRPDWVDSVWNSSCPNLSLLPVNFISFSGKINNTVLDLKWDVAQEVNVKEYIVERSVNGIDFFAINTKKANNSKTYQFADEILNFENKRIYYRIKNIDNNGKFGYSSILSIHIPKQNIFSYYPNPVKDVLNVNIINSANISSIQLIDVFGRTIYQTTVKNNTKNIQINTNQFKSGYYFLKLNNGEEAFVRKIFIAK